MKKMLPLLQSLADNHPDAEVQAMASDLRVAIATHGVIWSERLAKSTENKQVGYVINDGCCMKHILNGIHIIVYICLELCGLFLLLFP